MSKKPRMSFDISEEQAQRLKEIPRGYNISELLRKSFDQILDNILQDKSKTTSDEGQTEGIE